MNGKPDGNTVITVEVMKQAISTANPMRRSEPRPRQRV